MWFLYCNLGSYLVYFLYGKGFFERAERKVYFDILFLKYLASIMFLLLNAQKNNTRQQGII